MESRYDESNKITILSIIWNIVLTVIKIGAGVLGNSNAIIADGLHSASDILTSIGVLIGNKISKSPNDKEHNYGHEKAETLVALLLSIVLIFVALKIGYGGIISLLNVDKIKVPTILPLIVSVISILIKEYQYRITIKVANKINSPALKADAWHHRSDALSSIAAFIGIGGAIIGFKILDPLASIVVALFVSKVGADILLKSANEVANALAEHTAGSIQNFAVLMNAKARELGCQESHFNNPSGLNDPQHYTSAYDMALIAQAAFQNETFVTIDSSLYYDLPPTRHNPDGFRVYPGHRMLKKNTPQYYAGVIGGKTGYTMLAGNTLVTCAEKNGMKLITVILNGHQTHYTDTKALLDFGFANFQSVNIDHSRTSGSRSFGTAYAKGLLCDTAENSGHLGCPVCHQLRAA